MKTTRIELKHLIQEHYEQAIVYMEAEPVRVRMKRGSAKQRRYAGSSMDRFFFVEMFGRNRKDVHRAQFMILDAEPARQRGIDAIKAVLAAHYPDEDYGAWLETAVQHPPELINGVGHEKHGPVRVGRITLEQGVATLQVGVR